MCAKANAILHFVSALYAAILIGFVVVFVPRSLVPRFEVRILLAMAVSFLVLDGVAGLRQLRMPPSGHVFSVGLHLAFSASAIAAVTFEYLQNRPSPFISWLRKNDYGFFLLLGLIRFVAGGFLLGREP